MKSIPWLKILYMTFVAFILINSTYGWAVDVTFSCSDPPDKSAKLAIREGPLVNKFKDRGEKTCTFSVNGAKASSPDAELIRRGMNSFMKDGRIVRGLYDGNIENLAYVLLATAPVKEIPSDLQRFLRENAKNIGTCLDQFFHGDSPSFELYRNKGISGYCRGYERAPQYLDIEVVWRDERFVTNLYVHRKMIDWTPY